MYSYPSAKEVELFKKYGHLVEEVINKMTPHHILTRDDDISNGNYGLLKVIQNYDISRIDTFPIYAIRFIRGNILEERRKSDYRRLADGTRVYKNNELSYDDLRFGDGDVKLTANDVIAGNSNTSKEAMLMMLNKKMSESIARMSEEDQYIVNQHVVGVSFRKIAEKIGKPHTVVAYAYTRCMTRLRVLLSDIYED